MQSTTKTCEAFKKCKRCLNSSQHSSDLITCFLEDDLEKSAIERYNGTMPCGGESYESIYDRGPIYCVDCNHNSVIPEYDLRNKNYNDRYRCNLQIDAISKHPISCEIARNDIYICGKHGRMYLSKSDERDKAVKKLKEEMGVENGS